MKKSLKVLLWVVVLIVTVLLVTVFSSGGCRPVAPPVEEPAVEEPVVEEPAPTEDEWVTKGPHGEIAVDYSVLTLTEEEKQEIREGNYGAAFMWFSGHIFFQAIEAGAKAVFEDLNIDVVASMDTGVDVAKVKDNIETMMALDPKILLALALDPVSAAEAFQPAVDAGINLSFLSNVPQGYKFGEDYIGLVTDDLVGMGVACADMLAESLGGKGKIGFLYGDMGMWVTEQRDGAFKKAIEVKYPDIEIVAEAGIADYGKSNEIIAAMLITNPEIEGLYVVTDAAMGGVLAALREADRTDVKVVLIDIGLESAIDMAQGGNVVGIVADYPYQIGVAMAMSGAYGIIDKIPPDFITVGVIKINKDNLLEGWRESLNSEPPQELKDLYK